MSDHGILFQAAMVRALLAGRKTQTRRVLNPQPFHDRWGGDRVRVDFERGEDGVWRASTTFGGVREVRPVPRLRIAVGDRLWVRETFRIEEAFVDGVGSYPITVWVDYVADPDVPEADQRNGAHKRPWRAFFECDREEYDFRKYRKAVGRKFPGIHMPRWFSRLTLTVTDVRVQRLQDISVEDALAEGVLMTTYVSKDARAMYRDLTNSINGPGHWEANPWTAAYTFTVDPRNIDA